MQIPWRRLSGGSARTRRGRVSVSIRSSASIVGPRPPNWRSVGLFLLVAYLGTWAYWLLPSKILFFGPTAGGIVALAVWLGSTEAFRLVSRMLRPTGELSVVVAALITPLAIALSLVVGVRQSSYHADLTGGASFVFERFFVHLVLGGLAEEIGWRGFLLTYLAQRMRRLTASLA